jgi:hypothetical protein
MAKRHTPKSNINAAKRPTYQIDFDTEPIAAPFDRLDDELQNRV